MAVMDKRYKSFGYVTVRTNNNYDLLIFREFSPGMYRFFDMFRMGRREWTDSEIEKFIDENLSGEQ